MDETPDRFLRPDVLPGPTCFGMTLILSVNCGGKHWLFDASPGRRMRHEVLGHYDFPTDPGTYCALCAQAKCDAVAFAKRHPLPKRGPGCVRLSSAAEDEAAGEVVNKIRKKWRLGQRSPEHTAKIMVSRRANALARAALRGA